MSTNEERIVYVQGQRSRVGGFITVLLAASVALVVGLMASQFSIDLSELSSEPQTVFLTATPGAVAPIVPTVPVQGQVPAIQRPAVVPQPAVMPALPQVAPTPIVVYVTQEPAWVSGGGSEVRPQARDLPTAVPIPPTTAPLPEPGQPGFVESFKPEQCSPLVGYLPSDPCYKVVNPNGIANAAPTPLPQPGEAGFKESFK